MTPTGDLEKISQFNFKGEQYEIPWREEPTHFIVHICQNGTTKVNLFCVPHRRKLMIYLMTVPGT